MEEDKTSEPGLDSFIPHPSSLPLRILAAEDNEFNRDLLEHLLGRLGLSAVMAANGREALGLLGIRDQRTDVGDRLSLLTSDLRPLTSDFDLLLLDIHMPEMDGFQVIRAIREHEQRASGHLPVIALTAQSRKEDRERCLRAGMDECLTKPFTAADLWAVIDRVLGIRSQESAVSSQQSAAKSSLIHDPCPLPPDLDFLDPPVLLAACGGDPAMLRKMCRSLQSRVPEHLATIRGALRDRDALRLREAAHKFSGMLSAFSTVAGDQAASLEDLAARGLLEESIPVVDELDKSATELARLAGGLTIETLLKLAEPAERPQQTAP